MPVEDLAQVWKPPDCEGADWLPEDVAGPGQGAGLAVVARGSVPWGVPSRQASVEVPVWAGGPVPVEPRWSSLPNSRRWDSSHKG